MTRTVFAASTALCRALGALSGLLDPRQAPVSLVCSGSFGDVIAAVSSLWFVGHAVVSTLDKEVSLVRFPSSPLF